MNANEILTTCNNSGIVDWLLAGITLAAVLVAIFQDHIKRFFWKPKLVLELHTSPPDFQKISINRTDGQGRILGSGLSYYFRIRVKNVGSISAEHVEIQASKLSKLDGKTFEVINEFTPMNFVFSHTHEKSLEYLSPNMEKLCDFIHVIDPSENKFFIPYESNEPVIWFDLEVMPNNYGNLISGGGVYRIDIIVGASNIIKPIKRSILIDYSGKWNKDESEMVNQEIRLSMQEHTKIFY